MIEDLQNRLLSLEKEREVRILYASVGGSRAYGLENEDSDWDCHFVYCHPKSSYLNLRQPGEFIDCGDDLNGWEVRKFLGMVQKSAYSPFELLLSPLVVVDKGYGSEFLALANSFMNPPSLVRSYCGYVNRELKKYEKLDDIPKKVKSILSMVRLYASGDYLALTGKIAPLSFDALVQSSPDFFPEELQRLARAKRERDYTSIDPLSLDSIRDKTKALADSLFSSYREKNFSPTGTYEDANSLFRKIIVPVGYQCHFF